MWLGAADFTAWSGDAWPCPGGREFEISPFTFYRGAAAAMAAELAATPDSGIVVHACGDAHIADDVRDESAYIRELLDEYAGGLAPDRRYLFQTYRFLDVARKVVGVGSVGTRAWVFLLVGREGAVAAGEVAAVSGI